MDDDGLLLTAAFCIGITVGVIIGGGAISTDWQRDAIRHNVAEYDRESGAFRWKDGK